MKNLLLLILFFVTTVCISQIELEYSQEGVYRIKEGSQEWASSKITAEPKAVKYIDRFPQAINNAGEPILVEKNAKTLKLKPVFKKLVEVEARFIAYNDFTKVISYFELKKIQEETYYLVLFSFLSIFLMMISNIFFKKDYKLLAIIANAFSVLAAFMAFFLYVVDVALVLILDAALVFVTLDLVFIAFTIITAIFAFIFSATTMIKNYISSSIRFYFLMVAHVILLFLRQ